MASEEAISKRAFHVLRFIENKYVSILEEILAEEAEIKSRAERTPIDEIRLIGIEAMKKIIADELGLPYETEEPGLLELISRAEEAEAIA